MSVKETVREVMNAKGFTNALLAEKCGYNTPSGVSTKFERKTMNVTVFYTNQPQKNKPVSP